MSNRLVRHCRARSTGLATLVRLAALARFAALALLVAVALPEPGHAQRDARISIEELAARYLQGRYLMPVTCEQTDGTLVDVFEAVVVRPNERSDGSRFLRMTFFGIEAQHFKRCFNLVWRSVPDRRGVLYLNYVSNNPRPDYGIKDFKRDFMRGPLEYVITGGKLRTRDVEQPDRVNTLEFGDDGVSLYVSRIHRGSDGDKLLGEQKSAGASAPRRVQLRIGSLDQPSFEGFYAEDVERRR